MAKTMAQGSERKAARKNGRVQFLSREEGHALFDCQARKLMNMGGEEFLRRYDAGEFDAILDDPDHPDLMYLAMLTSFGR